MTDMDPQTLTQVSLQIFERWVAFAMGKEQLQGFTLKNPTGRYASSIRRKQVGPYRIVIDTNDKMAPEAVILEEGHSAIDLKRKLNPGKVYKMHRGQKGQYGSAGHGSPVYAPRKKNIWGEVRSRGAAGFARMPTHITAENMSSWVIPPMPAYSPAAHLVDLLRRGAFR